MTKVITDIELLKRLQPYIWEVESWTNLKFTFYWKTLEHQIKLWTEDKHNYLKTLDTDEAIDFILDNINLKYKFQKTIQIFKREDWYHYWISWMVDCIWKTQIEALTKLLDYLEKNNLLTKKD